MMRLFMLTPFGEKDFEIESHSQLKPKKNSVGAALAAAVASRGLGKLLETARTGGGMRPFQYVLAAGAPAYRRFALPLFGLQQQH
jgi:hypothetical protein